MTRADGQIVRSVQDVTSGEPIQTELADGRFSRTVSDPAEPAAPGGPRPGLILRAFLWAANRYLDLREDLRFTIDAALLSIRKALLEAGRRYSSSAMICTWTLGTFGWKRG